MAARREYFTSSRNRFNGNHIDLHDWLSNFGAFRLSGGLNLLAKLLGKPGKMEISGDQIYAMFRAGQLREINDYCLCDTLDTYFVFLRTRVLLGELTAELEKVLTHRAGLDRGQGRGNAGPEAIPGELGEIKQ